jgi:ABC-type multidrug transport system fused ATPase/permease subunit
MLDHGGVAETGTHDELIAAGGAYAQLMVSQLEPADSGLGP